MQQLLTMKLPAAMAFEGLPRLPANKQAVRRKHRSWLVISSGGASARAGSQLQRCPSSIVSPGSGLFRESSGSGPQARQERVIVVHPHKHSWAQPATARRPSCLSFPRVHGALRTLPADLPNCTQTASPYAGPMPWTSLPLRSRRSQSAGTGEARHVLFVPFHEPIKSQNICTRSGPTGKGKPRGTGMTCAS